MDKRMVPFYNGLSYSDAFFLAQTNASVLAATSSGVVAQEHTLIRMAGRSSQTVPPHQQTPPR
jgi:hypothetical protein